MNYKMTPAQVQSAIREKLSHIYGVSAKNASDDEFYKASALVVRDLLVRGRDEFVHEAEKQETKQIYYLCMEFLLGRSLKNNLFNLGLEDSFRKALSEMGVKLDNLYEQEPDAGLGNGGLGRLAACFLDGLATQGYPAMGYSLRYEYGIFRQKLVEGWQTELPDFWLPGGEVWMQKVDESAIEVHFDGYIEEQWHDHYHSVRHKNYNPVMAIPYDLYVSGMDGKGAVKAMEEGGAKLNGINALLYGAGGISGVTAYELAQSGVKKLYIANRTPEKAERIAKLVNENTAAAAEVIGTDAASLDKAAESCELFANLTPLGMKGFDKKHDYLGFIDRLPKTATVFDCIINPPLSETITAARAAGLNTVPGMRMLVAQLDVIFKFLFNQTVTGADKQACIEELCNYLGVPSNF